MNEDPAPTTTDAHPGAPVPRWALHRRLYDWILGFSHHPRATWVLAGMGFVEAFCPFVPPDALLVPMCLGNRRRCARFAAVAAAGSLVGAFVGYAIGALAVGLGESLVGADRITWLEGEFAVRGTAYVFIAAVTPVPFHLLTITSGVAGLSILPFFLACLVGRSLRYGLVALVFWWLGPRAVPLIDRWFNWLCIAVTVLVVALWFVLRSGG